MDTLMNHSCWKTSHIYNCTRLIHMLLFQSSLYNASPIKMISSITLMVTNTWYLYFPDWHLINVLVVFDKQQICQFCHMSYSTRQSCILFRFMSDRLAVLYLFQQGALMSNNTQYSMICLDKNGHTMILTFSLFYFVPKCIFGTALKVDHRTKHLAVSI